MDIFDYLNRLFAYDEWANQEVLAALRSAATPPARSLKLIAHILSAEGLWLVRLSRQKAVLPVWPDLTLAECDAEAEKLGVAWRSYLEECQGPGLARQIKYVNSKGENWTGRVDDILLHVITHSAYHRGQIASDMRAAGLTPAYTDFIHGVRQGLVK
ncbi:MAG TPA: DinB family protein [Terriglobales bacterium]|nr:DinB family protein [Terriglobales bacterium]